MDPTRIGTPPGTWPQERLTIVANDGKASIACGRDARTTTAAQKAGDERTKKTFAPKTQIILSRLYCEI